MNKGICGWGIARLPWLVAADEIWAVLQGRAAEIPFDVLLARFTVHVSLAVFRMGVRRHTCFSFFST